MVAACVENPVSNGSVQGADKGHPLLQIIAFLTAAVFFREPTLSGGSAPRRRKPQLWKIQLGLAQNRDHFSALNGPLKVHGELAFGFNSFDSSGERCDDLFEASCEVAQIPLDGSRRCWCVLWNAVMLRTSNLRT